MRFSRSRWRLLALGIGLLGGGAWLLWREIRESGESSRLLNLPAEALEDQALAAARSEVEKHPGDDQRWVELGEGLLSRADEGAATELCNRAEAVFLQALAINHQNAHAKSGVARVWAARRDVDRSIQSAKEAIAIDPKVASAYRVLLDAALVKGDYESAQEHAQRLIDISPDADSYCRAAQLLYLTGDFRKSTWMYRRALELARAGSDQAASCQAQLALLQWRNGALLPAEQLLQTALAQSPNHRGLLLAMGKVKAGRKDYAAAIELYSKALQKRPDAAALAELGDLYLASGQPHEAEKRFLQVEEHFRRRSPEDLLAGLEAARFFADHDRNLPEALKLAEAANREYRSVFAADTLAWCYYKNGRFKEASEAIARALRRKTPDASILFHAGMIFSKLGNRVQAQKHLYKALSLNPSFHPTHCELAAETLKTLGSHAAAEPAEPAAESGG